MKIIFLDLEIDIDINGLVVGFDPDFNFFKMSYASLILH